MTILARAALMGAVVLLIAVAPVTAHADLVRSDPAAGEAVEGTPVEISGVFSETLDPAASSLLLIDAEGERLAEGGVDADDETQTRMRLEPPALAPGTYQVRWTARTPEGGGVVRGRWAFTVAETAETSDPVPTGTAGSSPTVSQPAPSADPGPLSPSGTPTAPSPAAPSPTPSAPSVAPGETDSDPMGGAAVPLLALAAVAAAAVVFLARRPR